MAAVTARLCCALLFVLELVCGEQETITAESGQDVTLTCRAPNSNIIAVEWSRADLGSEYVLFYRNEQLDPENQHPSFMNRVDLQDRQMKDGDVSVILKNVTAADSGTYKCRVFIRGTNNDFISIITLRVSPPPPPPPGPGGGATEDEEEEEGLPVGLIVGVSVAALLLVVAAVVGFVIYRKRKKQQQSQRSQESYI